MTVPNRQRSLGLHGRTERSGSTARSSDARAGHIAIDTGTSHFQNVSEDAWRYKVGGHQVLHKWLSERRGRDLSELEMKTYQSIIGAAAESTMLMAEIDAVADEFGGWVAIMDQEIPDSSKVK